MFQCAETRIGGFFQRGLSGGERKRVSIALELLKDESSVLLLDEPSSGLDSATAYHILYTLRQLATQRDRTVICTIHQPHSKIYKLFDKVLLLSHGRCVYMGPAQDALSYFSDLGFPAKEHTNPSDHMIDLCSVDGRTFEAEVRSLRQLDMLTEAYSTSKLAQSNMSDMEHFVQDCLDAQLNVKEQNFILASSKELTYFVRYAFICFYLYPHSYV